MERIELGNVVFEGHNNAYLFGAADGGPTVLVDTSFGRDRIADQLSAGIEAAGVPIADLDAIVLTHYHMDHSGAAGRLQELSGATVYAPEGDDDLVAGVDGAWDGHLERHERKITAWDVPERKRSELLAFLADLWDVSAHPTDVEPVRDGDTLDAGGVTLEAVALPGHTVGHTGYAIQAGAERDLLSGDALLPHYTPNVGGADVRVTNALETYVRSLTRIVEAGFDSAHPGHREAIREPAVRANEIIAHHRERTERVLDVLDEDEGVSVWEVSQALFGELSSVHILHGPGEAYAHLEHLEAAGAVSETDDGYVLVEPDVDVASLFPTGGS